MASQKRLQLCGCGIALASTLMCASHVQMGTLFAGSSEARYEPWPKRLSFQDLTAHRGGLERTLFCRQDHAGKLLREAGCRPLLTFLHKEAAESGSELQVKVLCLSQPHCVPGLPATGPALCRAILKASKSPGLPKAGEETIRAAGAAADDGTSLEYVSASSRGIPWPLQCREARARFRSLIHSLLPLHDGPIWRGDSQVSWEGVYFKELLKEHDLYSQITVDSH